MFVHRSRCVLGLISKIRPIYYASIKYPVSSFVNHETIAFYCNQGFLRSGSKYKKFDANVRYFHENSTLFSAENNEVEEKSNEEKKKPLDPSKDRTKIIPPETSIRYMESKAYKITYGDDPVWVKYRRNFKGQFAPRTTRKLCIRAGIISTGNPCPICRDEYLILDYTNVKLLKQFISPHTGEIYETKVTNICQKKQLELEVAVEKARFYGLLTFEVPFRQYDYREYYPSWKN